KKTLSLAAGTERGKRFPVFEDLAKRFEGPGSRKAGCFDLDDLIEIRMRERRQSDLPDVTSANRTGRISTSVRRISVCSHESNSFAWVSRLRLSLTIFCTSE